MNEKAKVMVVEDDVFVMDIYRTKLAQEGYEVFSASDGKEAMEKMKSNKPDLILLDILMPNMNGMEVLQKMKDSEDLKNIPVILLTNLSQQEEISKGINLGANDYLIKSHFTPSEVVEKIKNCLK